MTQLEKIAKTLIQYSLNLKAGDSIILENFDYNANILVQSICAYCKDNGISVTLLNHNVDEYIKKIDSLSDSEFTEWADSDLALFKSVDAYLKTSIFIDDFKEFNMLPKEKKARYMQVYYKTIHKDYRVDKMNWCLTKLPEENEVSKNHFTNDSLQEYYYTLCSVDYKELAKTAKILEEKLINSKNVHIVGINTDLTFSIEGLPAIPCVGRKNFPDGEVYTAPLRESVNGKIQYNIPSYSNGLIFNNITFEIKDGKIIKASCDEHEDVLNEILNTDEGSRYFGEFSFGINPHAIYPIGNTLMDEKLAGSFHLTPGSSYGQCNNDNHSLVHWDLVCSQLIENGGGQIYLDGKLFRNNGYFIDDDLKSLNPIQ